MLEHRHAVGHRLIRLEPPAQLVANLDYLATRSHAVACGTRQLVGSSVQLLECGAGGPPPTLPGQVDYLVEQDVDGVIFGRRV